jgi:dTDP-glucose 4,6-dehydratase
VCYVSDTVEGILRLAFSDHAGPVNIGNPDERSVLAIAQDVLAITGSASGVEFVERPQDDPMVRRPDTTRARELLGWEPKVAWRDGLSETVAWFRQAVRAANGQPAELQER